MCGGEGQSRPNFQDSILPFPEKELRETNRNIGI
jgi:hypothetical protein